MFALLFGHVDRNVGAFLGGDRLALCLGNLKDKIGRFDIQLNLGHTDQSC